MSPCNFTNLPGFGYAIVCTHGKKRQKCAYCKKLADLLCDFKIGNGKTCDKPICKRCAVSIGPNVDHCFTHVVLGEKES